MAAHYFFRFLSAVPPSYWKSVYREKKKKTELIFLLIFVSS